MTGKNKTFSFYLLKGTIYVVFIVCNVLVNHVCLHAVFLYVSVLKEFMFYVASCTEFNNTFDW